MIFPHVDYLGPAHPAFPAALDADPEGTAARELDSRTSDGIHVRLLWHPEDGSVSVAVRDTKTGDSFELRVRQDDRPLDVFHHPYAYEHSRRKSGGQRWLGSTDTAVAA
jgi:hypothetical protein